METVRARRGTIALSHQIVDRVSNGPGGSTINSNAAETLFVLVVVGHEVLDMGTGLR